MAVHQDRPTPDVILVEEEDRDNLEEAIQKIAKEMLAPREVDCQTFRLTVRRKYILTDALEQFELAFGNQLFQPLEVIFLGESAVDDGGPQREFSSLFILQCAESYMMEGEYFSNDIAALESNDYLHLGRLVALTLLQGGAGFPMLATPVAEYIITGKVTSVMETDFPDDMQDCVSKLMNIDLHKVEDLDTILPDRERYGSKKPAANMSREDIALVIQAMYIHHVLGRFHASLAQFVEGLNIGGILNRLKILGPRSQVFFDRNAIRPLTSNIMEDLMDMQYTGPPGSNIRNEEESVARSWICFLRAAESGRAEINDEFTGEKMSLHLQEVLMWLTGARIVPAIGLPRKISVHFCKIIKLPKVSTCGPSLTLPICPETQRGRRSIFVFAKWILDSQGFGQV